MHIGYKMAELSFSKLKKKTCLQLSSTSTTLNFIFMIISYTKLIYLVLHLVRHRTQRTSRIQTELVSLLVSVVLCCSTGFISSWLNLLKKIWASHEKKKIMREQRLFCVMRKKSKCRKERQNVKCNV